MMYNFTQWLEDRAPIIFSVFHPDGTVVVYIRGIRHVFATNPDYLTPNFQKWSRRAPGKALAKLKSWNPIQYEPREDLNKPEKLPPPKAKSFKQWTQKKLF